MTWSTLATTGTAPEVRDGHCMTTNEDGTKVVIIGGQLRNKTVVGDLWVLDLLTATWSQGLSGPIRANAVCTIAGDQVIIWGGRNSSTSDAPSEMLIYDLKTSIYVKQYSAPAFYKDLRPPPAPTRTTALWPAEESALINGVQKRSSVPVGAAIGGALGGIVLIGAVAGLCFGQQRRRRQQKQTERHRIESGIFKGLGGLLGRARGRRSRKMLWRNNPQETHDDEILERTLRELEERDKKLEDRKRQLSQKRQLLVLQHQQSISRAPLNEKRGPTAVVDPTTESMFPLPPTSPHQPIPEPVLYSPEDLNDRRTVQAVFTPPGIMSLRESDLAQDTIEPVYGPSPEVNFDIPDLVYVPPPNVGMDWTKQRLVTKLYIVGGVVPLGSDFDKIPQFMSLDLNIPWNTTAPAWTQLADGPRQWLVPVTFSSDEQVMYAFHIRGTTLPWKYDLQKNTWQEMATPQFENTATVGVKAVTDPRTGLIYLAAGSDNANNRVAPLKQLDIFDPVSQTIHSIDLKDPAKPFPVRLNQPKEQRQT
ncbi:hypothetical protein EC991_005264 [Linnemannia zychae]|nr:hypothetical protein EC991_005264 [Linnemannia zychae]